MYKIIILFLVSAISFNVTQATPWKPGNQRVHGGMSADYSADNEASEIEASSGSGIDETSAGEVGSNNQMVVGSDDDWNIRLNAEVAYVQGWRDVVNGTVRSDETDPNYMLGTLDSNSARINSCISELTQSNLNAQDCHTILHEINAARQRVQAQAMRFNQNQ